MIRNIYSPFLIRGVWHIASDVSVLTASLIANFMNSKGLVLVDYREAAGRITWWQPDG